MRLTLESRNGSWQETCTRELIRCAELERKSPGAGQEAWNIAREGLSKQKRVIIADADFTRAPLKQFNFSRCYFARINFAGADLSKCTFRQTIFRQTDFSLAYLDDADLSLADLRTCNLNMATAVGDLKGVRPWLAEQIQTQQYRSDHDIDNKSWFLRQWYALTQHGSSISGLLRISAIVILFFGGAFYALQSALGENITSAHENFLGMLAFATLNFLNAGPPTVSQNPLVLILVILNVMAGVGALGIFIAVLARKLIVHI